MKYIVLLASVLIQVCIGGLYAWSSFVPALKVSCGLSAAQTQILFGCLIAMFTVAMVFAGRLLARRGPRWVASVGGLLFGAGYVIASRSDGSFPVLFLGVGIVAGVGTGFGYVVPLATCMKWFPERKGLVTGIAVAGFGSGAVLLSAWAELFFSQGFGVLTIFGWIGITYGIVIWAAALALRLPPHLEDTRPRPPLKLGALHRDFFFIAMAVGMFCGTFAGLLVIGNLKPLALSAGATPFLAGAVITVFAVGNAAGRIAWGWTADRFAGRSVSLSLLFLAAALGLLRCTMASTAGVVGASMLIGFGFGACFVVYATQVVARYGIDRFGDVYPLVFLTYGAAGIAGPWIGGWRYDVTANYTCAIDISITVVLAGWLTCIGLLRMANATAGANQ